MAGSPCDLLEVAPEASQEEIKRAFRHGSPYL